MRATILTLLLTFSLLATPLAAATRDSAPTSENGLGARIRALVSSCHEAEKPGSNATRDERRSWAHCVRDTIKAFFVDLRAGPGNGAETAEGAKEKASDAADQGAARTSQGAEHANPRAATARASR